MSLEWTRARALQRQIRNRDWPRLRRGTGWVELTIEFASIVMLRVVRARFDENEPTTRLLQSVDSADLHEEAKAGR